MIIHPLITTTEALRALCERLSHAEFVTVDTEFMRENTFWPELCLVQIADTEEAAAIDPLAPGQHEESGSVWHCGNDIAVG